MTARELMHDIDIQSEVRIVYYNERLEERIDVPEHLAYDADIRYMYPEGDALFIEVDLRTAPYIEEALEYIENFLYRAYGWKFVKNNPFDDLSDIPLAGVSFVEDDEYTVQVRADLFNNRLVQTVNGAEFKEWKDNSLEDLVELTLKYLDVEELEKFDRDEVIEFWNS